MYVCAREYFDCVRQKGYGRRGQSFSRKQFPVLEEF